MRIIKGTDQTIPVTFSDTDGAINITGATVYFTVKRKLTDEDIVIAYSTSSHTTPLEGETQIVLTRAQTNIDAELYYWDLQLMKNDTLSATEYGTLEIIQSVRDAD